MDELLEELRGVEGVMCVYFDPLTGEFYDEFTGELVDITAMD